MAGARAVGKADELQRPMLFGNGFRQIEGMMAQVDGVVVMVEMGWAS